MNRHEQVLTITGDRKRFSGKEMNRMNSFLQLVTLGEKHIPAMEALLSTVNFDPPVWEDLLQMDRRDLLGIWDSEGDVSSCALL